MSEQTKSARALPTGPGWWWRHAYGDREAVHVIAYNGARSMPRGSDLVWFDASPSHHDEREVVGWTAVTDDDEWIAPVAPVGSVPPEVYARDVRSAYMEGACEADEMLADDTLAGGDEVARWWAQRSKSRASVADALTAHGLTPEQAADVVAGVAP